MLGPTAKVWPLRACPEVLSLLPVAGGWGGVPGEVSRLLLPGALGSATLCSDGVGFATRVFQLNVWSKGTQDAELCGKATGQQPTAEDGGGFWWATGEA